MKLRKLAYLMAAFLVSCQAGDQKNSEITAVIENLTNSVVVPTYADLYQDAQALNAAVQAIQRGDDVSFEAAKKAWAKARDSWEQSEGFLFGPVDFEEIDPALDSWPADLTAIREMLQADISIDQNLISRNPEARGFHLIEFLLWGEDQKKKVGALQERELEFLKIASQDFENNTKQLYESWTLSENSFQNVMKSSGASNQYYTSEQEVLQEFIEGMIGLADEVANEKIAGPLQEEAGVPSPELQESFFSDLSKFDLLNNIKSISNIYYGDYAGHKGLGIQDLLMKKDAELDKKIQEAILHAIQALEKLPDSFTQAIHENRMDVKEAQERVQALHDALLQLSAIKF